MFKKVLKHIRAGTLLNTLSEIKEARRNESKIQQEIAGALSWPDQHSIAATEKIIHKYFDYPFSKRHGLPRSYGRQLARFIVSRRRGSLLPDDQYANLLEQTEEINHARLCCHDWKKLCYLSLCNGLFRASAIHRNKAIKSAYQKAMTGSASPEELSEAFKAAVDQQDHETADRIYRLMSKRSGNNQYRDKYYLFYNLLKGDKEEALPVARSFFSDNDWAYAKYLQGKSVAVVGPAPSGEDITETIDNYDLVARFKYSGKESLADSREFGTRVNVSYYNNSFIKNASKLENRNFFADPDFVVFKDVRYPFQEELQNKKRGRVVFSPDYGLFNGFSNLILLVLFDLIHYEPSLIKVFKINFYLAQKTHYEGFKHEGFLLKQAKADYTGKWYDFAVHNPLTQLNLTRNLWRSGQIEVDDQCEVVLSLSDEQYMSKLEEIYVKQPILMRSAEKEKGQA